MVSYTYTTFGVDTTFPASKQPYVKNPYRYNGEYIDFIHGAPDLQYLRARYYDAAEGRFTTRDTVWGKIEVPLSQNLYVYVGNNPILYTDPSGNTPKKFSDRFTETKEEYEANWNRINELEKIGLSARQYVQSELDRLYSANVELSRQMKVMMGESDVYVDNQINNAENGSKRAACWFDNMATGQSYAPQVKVALESLYAQLEKDYKNSSGKYREDIPVFMAAISQLLDSLTGSNVGTLPDGLKMHIMIDENPNDDFMRFVLPLMESLPGLGDMLTLTKLMEDETTTSDDWKEFGLSLGVRGIGKIAGHYQIEDMRKIFKNIGTGQTAIALKDELVNAPDYMVQVNIWMQIGNSETSRDQYSYNYDVGIYPNKNNATFMQWSGYSGSLLNGDYPTFVGDGTWNGE